MGAEQSSVRDKVVGSQESTKRCYYDVLGVGRQASDNEIKKAFREKALLFHPDRNYGDVDNATKRFAELQSAYEVLSDPQERAWYDSHRDAILQNCDIGDDHFERNVRLTSAEDIVKLISNFSSSMPFTDKPNGFFGTFRSVFDILAKEETEACDLEFLEATHYPSFGSAEDSYEDVVRPFYASWVGFSTKKKFSWKDAYKYSEAPDRQTRRLMEKKNKRFRDDGVREFNDAVRSLVRFVRKRDPRYRGNLQSEEDRQKILREAAAAQAARSRAANQAKIGPQAMPALAQVAGFEEEVLSSESELSDKDIYECIACTKIFKSENQYEAHERSKKHIKAIRDLRRRMERENEGSNIYSEILNRGDAIKRSDFRHGSRSTGTDMQSPLQARRSSIEYSDGSQNATMTSAHVDPGTETDLFQELGTRLGAISTSDPILARDDEILDEHASRE